MTGVPTGAPTGAPSGVPSGSNGVSRRQFLRSGSLGAAAVVAAGVMGAGVMGAGVVTSCSALRADDNGFAAVFGPRTPQVSALGQAALGSGVLEVASVDSVVAMVPSEGIVISSVISSDGSDRLVVDVTDPEAFIAVYEARTVSELVSGPLVFVEGFPLTMTEAAVAAATALAG